MITIAELKARIHANPFIPFRVCMSDGTTYDITNHDMIWLTKSSVYVGVSLGDDEVVERGIQCALLHISRIEDNIPAKAA